MSNKIQKAKELMERGWKTREDLDFENAEKLLNEAKDIFEEEEDWFNVTECLNHLAYGEKIRVVHSASKGLELAEEALKTVEEHGTEKVLVLRALLSLSAAAANYERALRYAEEVLDLFDESAAKADILASYASFQLRTGNIEGAKKTINEALSMLGKYWEVEREPHRSIWKVGALKIKAEILYNSGDIEESKKVVEEALEIAKDKDLKTRIVQTETFLSLFE